MLNQVLEAYPKDVRLVFKHFPLNMHPQARPAAEATLFAGKKGKFWEMHDLIFKNSSRIGMDLFKELARQIGLDEKALEQSVSTQAFKAEIDKDLLEGQKAGVTGTPTIFINGKRVPRRDLETFKRLIDEILASKGSAAK